MLGKATLGKVVKQVRLASRNTETTWRYGYHLPDVIAYRLGNRPSPSTEVNRVVDDLNRDGVARTSAAALLASHAVYNELCAEVDRLHVERAAELDKAREKGVEGAEKTYSYEFFDRHPKPGTVLTRFALQPEFQQVASQYLGMKGKLRGANIWRTMVSGDDARQSQTWHRDPEDRYVVKVFMLMSEVDDGCGPFHYAKGSHMKGADARLRAVSQYGLSDDQMAALVPRDQWLIGKGTPGTIIFADTRGYHKGGLARERERLVFIGMYLAF